MNPGAEAFDDQFSAAAYTESLVNLLDVVMHRVLRQTQSRGDLLLALPFQQTHQGALEPQRQFRDDASVLIVFSPALLHEWDQRPMQPVYQQTLVLAESLRTPRPMQPHRPDAMRRTRGHDRIDA